MPPVALRKESVDRNMGVGTTRDSLGVSLSARRAWIEISVEAVYSTVTRVALRKESVDRNCAGFVAGSKHIWSLSARRAWIEIIQ